jgi:hypothetical protein
MKNSFSISAALLLLGSSACNRLRNQRPYAVVGDIVVPVKAAFNADAGKVRGAHGGFTHLRRVSGRRV